MIEIITIIYFAINIFMAGYYFADNEHELKHKILLALLVFISFGVVILFYYFFLKIFDSWLYQEIQFQYRFRFTKYWDKILLDDEYSEQYGDLKTKLDRMSKLTFDSSKQMKRHNRMLNRKYGDTK